MLRLSLCICVISFCTLHALSCTFTPSSHWPLLPRSLWPILAASTPSAYSNHAICVHSLSCIFTPTSFACYSEVWFLSFFLRCNPSPLGYTSASALCRLQGRLQHPRAFLLLLLNFCLCLPPAARCVPCLRCTFAPVCHCA